MELHGKVEKVTENLPKTSEHFMNISQLWKGVQKTTEKSNSLM